MYDGKADATAGWMCCEALYDYGGLYHTGENTWATRLPGEGGIDGINMNHFFSTVQFLRISDGLL